MTKRRRQTEVSQTRNAAKLATHPFEVATGPDRMSLVRLAAILSRGRTDAELVVQLDDLARRTADRLQAFEKMAATLPPAVATSSYVTDMRVALRQLDKDVMRLGRNVFDGGKKQL